MATKARAANDSNVSYSAMVEETPTDFRVRTKAYTDPDVFDQEMHLIFEKTWVYVGHESEIEEPGDYKTSTVGLNPVIVSRGADGEVRVMLNECRHRGNAVCRTSRGNSKNFRCPYHDWIYQNTGELISPSFPRAYPPEFDKTTMGLVQLRVGVYRGLIFASMNPLVRSLDEHLGDVKHYIDLWADLSPQSEWRPLRPHKYGYEGNWKFQAENGHDGWHARFVHESAFETFKKFTPRPGTGPVVGKTRGFAGGHGILERPGIYEGLSEEQLDLWKKMLVEKHGQERMDSIMFVRHIFLFPNLYLFDNLIRVIKPISTSRTEVSSSFLSLRGVPDEWNKVRLQEAQGRLGTTGLVSEDDLEMFASNQTGMLSSGMDWVVLSHGIHQETSGPLGEREGEDMSEVPQRSIYREWARLMSLNGSNRTSTRS
jgi:phenylpropionate dioxygenase-like ring-hydroxylating dioxygenase large terminal subunit